MTEDRRGQLRAFVDDELSASERAEVEKELARSEAARRELDELEALDAQAQALLAIDEGEPRVPAAWRAVRARGFGSRSLRTGVIVAVLAAVAAAVLLFLRPAGTAASHGAVEADERTTVAIADRAVAVAEPGAALSWKVEATGAARVRQTIGAVFYRVNTGDAFVVDTPAGQVTVTGTCFTVEFKTMQDKIKLAASAASGAAVAAAVFLTVHEGSVVLANERGEVEVTAGGRASARNGSAPEIDGGDRPEPPNASAAPRYQTLVRENARQREALRELKERLLAAENPEAATKQKVDRDSPEYRKKVAIKCARSGGCDSKLWTDPSVEELRELAKCGRLLVDTPTFMWGDDFFPRGHVIEASGLSEAQANRYAELAEEMYVESGDMLTGFAVELGVPAEFVDRLSPAQLRGLVGSVVDEGPTRQRLADERAALDTPPPVEEQDAGERALRYMWGMGDAFEQRLGQEFGHDAASEMRRAGGGWLSKASMGGNACGR